MNKTVKFRNLLYIYISSITILIGTSQFLLSQTTDTLITVNKENIREHTYQLGSDSYQGRGTGTEGESEAAKYITNFLNEYGILPIGDRMSYYQNIPMHGSYPLKSSRFILQVNNSDQVLKLGYEAKGLWGGVIILGSAPLNVAAGENNIEGIPTTEPRGIYGGDDEDDNSGVLRYVSIRHGGIAIGEGNEINGLTLGGVGRGTTIEYVEVWSNQDDGFEFFGGTVNLKHLIAAFCGDDSYDHDEGLQSKMQFIFAIQSATSGDRCGEHDGAPSSDVGAEPWAYPVIYNATFLGSGKESYNADQDQLIKMRENWGGEYKNSIFGDYAGIGVDIENKTTPDSKLRLDEGSLLLENNLWFDFAAGVVFDSLGKHDWEVAYLKDAANGNTVADPMLKGISRDQTGGLDPRPNPDGPAYRDLADFPTPIDVSNFSNKIPDGYVLKQNYPNPFNPVTKIDFAIPVTEMVDLSIYNILGQKVVTLVNGVQKAGNYSTQFDASSLASGWYIYRLQTDSKVMSRKMLLIK